MTKKKKRKQTESNVSPEEKSIKLREVFQKGNTVTKLNKKQTVGKRIYFLNS